MSPDFDVTDWGGPVPALPPSTRPPRHKPGAEFLKGPIPWAWIKRAASLRGRSLAVGLAIWFEAGCRKTDTVKMSLARLQRLGISEGSARRGLNSLKAANLVSVVSLPGRAAEVTLLQVG